MSSVSSSPALTAARYEIAVAKKALATTREQGEQAVALIQAAEPPAATPQGSLGHLLDIRA